MGSIGMIGSGLLQAGAAKSAAGAQTAADQQAIAGQRAQYAQTTSNLTPYMQAGTTNLNAYQNQPATSTAALSTAYNNAQSLSDPRTLSMAQLQATPSYQFNLQQGTAATQASAAARGLGVSGAALKGASNYASGLASSTYQNAFNQNQAAYTDASQQFANQTTAQNTAFNQLQGTVNTGQNAANTLANYGQQSQNAISGAYGNIGTAQAAGDIGQANGYASALMGGASLLSNGLGSVGGIGGLSGYVSAAGQYLNPYGAAQGGTAAVGSNGLAGGGV